MFSKQEETPEKLIVDIIESIKITDPRFDIQNLTQTESYPAKFTFISNLNKNTELNLINISIYFDHKGNLSLNPTNKLQNYRLVKKEISLYECGSFYILPYYQSNSNLPRYWIGTKNTTTDWLLAYPSSWEYSENKNYCSNIVKAIKPLLTIFSLEKLDLRLGIRHLKDSELVNKLADIINHNQNLGFLNLELNVPDIKPILDELCSLTNLKELRLYNYSWTNKNVETFTDFWKSEKRKSSINTLDLGNLTFINPPFTETGNILMSNLLYVLFIWRNNRKELKRLSIKCGEIGSNAFHNYILENSEQCFLEELGIFSSEKLPENVRKNVLEIWENNKNLTSLLTNEENLCFKRRDAKFAMKKLFIRELMTISQGVYEKKLDKSKNHFAGNSDIAFSILSCLGKLYGFDEPAVQFCITLVLCNFREYNKKRTEHGSFFKRENVKNWWQQSIVANEKELRIFKGAAENQEIKTIGFASAEDNSQFNSISKNAF